MFVFFNLPVLSPERVGLETEIKEIQRVYYFIKNVIKDACRRFHSVVISMKLYVLVTFVGQQFTIRDVMKLLEMTLTRV